VAGAAGFTKLSETEQARGYAFTLVKARFQAPDGGQFERDIIHHPGAVAVLPWHDDGTITLVHQYRATLEHDLLEVPAGVCDVAGESDEHTAERELAEEAGLAASTIEHLVTIHNAPGMSDERITIFVAQGLVPVAGAPQGEEEEAMTIERVALPDALDMIDDGRITDAKTIIGILLLARRLA
jgi:8-oxo-dGTP pyrophosphatase MutT (NUDIX family)